VFLLSFVLAVWTARSEIAVYPFPIVIPIPSGEETVTGFWVENVGSAPAEVHISLYDWWRNPEGQYQLLPPGTLEGSCAPWITYSPNVLRLAPGEKAQVVIRVQVPEDAYGDRWALFSVAEYPPGTREGTGQTAEGTSVVVVYWVKFLRQDPEHASPAGEIRSVEVTSVNPLKLRIVYVNTGNAHTVNHGTVEVRDIFGETVRSFPIGKFPTLPGEERIIVVEDPTGEPLPEGIYYAFATIDFGGEYLVQGGVMVQVPPPE